MTGVGSSCLDRTVYVGALDALMDALTTGDMDGMNGVLANEIAANLSILDQVRHGIAEHGVMTPVYERTKDGEVIADPRSETGEPMVFEIKPNPLLAVLIQMTDKLGINFAELLATPRARVQAKTGEQQADAVQSFLGALAQRGAKSNRLPAPGDD
jgi:hypothetical protein